MHLVMAALLGVALYREHATVEALEGERLRTQARVVDENLIRQLEGAGNALTGLGADLRGFDVVFDEAPLTAKLQLLTSAMPGISSMLVLDAEGTIVASTREGLVGKNFHQREYFEAPRRGNDPASLYVSPPFTTSLGTYVIVLSRAVLNEQGRFVGVVTATLDPGYFSVVLGSVLYAPDMRTTLVHGDGKVFLDLPTDAATLGRDLSTSTTIFSRHQRSGELTSLAQGWSMASGDERMYAMRNLDQRRLRLSRPLVVSVSREVGAIYGPWRSRAWQMSLLLAGLVLVSDLALWLSQRRRSLLEAVDAAVARERQLGTERVELALRGADLGLWDLHVPSDRFTVNTRERTMLGYDADEYLPQGVAWRELIHPDDRAMVAAAILPHLKGQAESYRCEHRMRHSDGHHIWLSTRAMIVERGSKGEAIRIIGTHLDITERKQAEQQNARNEERLSLALEGSSLALFDWDLVSGDIFHSAQAAAMRGDPAIETTTPAVEQQRFVHPEDLPGLISRLKDALTGATELYSAEFRQRRNNGGWVWVRAQGRVVQRDASGRALRLAGTYADVNDRKIAESRLRRLAEFDTLTGLPNRALFHDRLQQAMARANRGGPMALLFLDVDRFKDINDTLGHEAGDKLLKVFAIRMQAAVRESDTVARLAGDEFTIILEGLRDAADARMLAGKMVETLRQPIELGGQSVEVTASIGVTLCIPGEGDDAALLRRADAALYEAKRRGRNGYFLDDEEKVGGVTVSVDASTPADPVAVDHD
ncbi:diguanylate cyclase domain-containing protein [Rhizobacter sp. OV335]|uniref:diguanylate cyclase domain-containing protein n=1 Tax=Rhizobacter sp. OV335 TaxID=1500264 RepID=UPI00091ACE7E|nr:diguanylate cyclase [Rhizobacter sp. OV335]SHN13844.1 PAS domain S-box-containing protein/diguanylate cyclase (GGDEF) domain-containing protein [Rhizobacter sp. OV335]